MTWLKNDYNEVLRGDNFLVSYNPDTAQVRAAMEITKIGNLMAEAMDAKQRFDDGAETALVFTDEEGRRRYWILKGDFRKEYEPLVPQGLSACQDFFMLHPAEASPWSDHTKFR